MTAGCGLPSFVGRSKNSGGFLGFGDHAADSAKVVIAPRPAALACSGVVIASAVAAFCPGFKLAVKQQELKAYKLEKTSGCFMPMRTVPYPPIECPAKPRLMRSANVR